MKWFKWRETSWGGYTFALLAAVLFMTVINHLRLILGGIGTFIGYFTPVIYGLILAYIMDFFVKYVESWISARAKEKTARIWSVIIIVVLVVLLTVLLFIALIPSLINSVTDIVSNWSEYEIQLTSMVAAVTKKIGSLGVEVDSVNLNTLTNTAMETISNYFSNNSSMVIQQITNFGSQLVTWVLAFIIAIYFLMAKNNLLKGVRKMHNLIIPKKAHEKSNTTFAKINAIFSKYIVCQIVDAMIVGVSNAVFMMIAQIPYVALISVVVGLTNLAPTFGPIVGGAIGAFILLLVKPSAVIPFVIFTVILQTIDGYVIKPKFYGGALSVPSVWVLVAIVVMGRMFGVAGILLAIPVAAIITYWLREIMSKHSGGEESVDAKPAKDTTEMGEKGKEKS